MQEANIEYATQYTFPNLTGVNGGRLRFDFAVFKNGILSHLIEYNGKQHYERSKGAWAEGFETLQEHDAKKQKYCLDNNIRLITLRYDTNYSLEDLL